MSYLLPRKFDWPVAAICLALSGFGIGAVPFVGTKYGDWPEAVALAIGLLPIIFLGVYIVYRTHVRINELEQRLDALEGRK